MDSTKSATMRISSTRKCQSDSEYMNVDIPATHNEDENYVNTNPVAQSYTYVNLKPISDLKDSHESATEYANVEFTGTNGENVTSTSDGEPLSLKAPTITLQDNSASKLNHVNFEKSVVNCKNTSEGVEEVDGQISTCYDVGESSIADEHTAPCNYEEATPMPKLLPSVQAKTNSEYVNFVPNKMPFATAEPLLPSEYVEMVGQHPLEHPQTAVRCEDFVPIKTPPATANDDDTSLPSDHVEMSIGQHSTPKGYEDFIPIKTLPATADDETLLPSDHVEMSIGQHSTPKGYEDFVPIKTLPDDETPLPSDHVEMSIGHHSTPKGYEDFVPIKTLPATADTLELSEHEIMSPTGQRVPDHLQTEPAKEYEDFVPFPNTDKEQHSTEKELGSDEVSEGYLRLQFKNKDHPIVLEQAEDSAYSSLSHFSRTGLTPDSFYSKLDVSETSKTGFYDRISNNEKPPVPSRNLKKPINTYKPSSDFSTLIPPLPPRNPSSQKVPCSSSPPPALPVRPKPVILPRLSSTGSSKPPTPSITNDQSPSRLNYCEVEFTDIGQPKFRPRSKAIDQPLTLQHNNYAIVDKDASVGLQLALEQKKHDRQ